MPLLELHCKIKFKKNSKKKSVNSELVKIQLVILKRTDFENLEKSPKKLPVVFFANSAPDARSKPVNIIAEN